ncbi:transferrin-binding protein-like solute binding protein [Altererythrobacter fulvus]|uniref:transferrin-binding protein-like solute binding protein n=1 Tax=Caenibius fulvus TaxID=2126012 RepID=UPI003019DF72
MSGLPADTAINTASFYGGVTLSGSVSGGRNNYGSTVQVRYSVTTGKIEILKSGNAVASFLPSDLDTTNSGDGLAIFQKGQVTIPLSTTTLPKEVLELHVPQIGGVPLSYTRFGTYLNLNVSLLQQKIDPLAAFVFGQPTASGSMPTSGSATYRSDVYGAVFVPNGTSPSLYAMGDGSGSATFSANFASGTVSTLINLAGNDALGSGGYATFGSVSGSGSILSGGPAFSGSLSGSGSGGFTGAFFGPSAVEMGYVFNVQGTYNSTEFVAYGNVFGTTASPPP